MKCGVQRKGRESVSMGEWRRLQGVVGQLEHRVDKLNEDN